MNNPLGKRVLLALTGFLTIICVVWFASTQVNSNRGAPDPRLAEHEHEVDQLRQRESLMASVGKGPLPAVFLAETEYDFGTVDPGTSNKHAFVIENRGEGPLALIAGAPSCSCTLSELEETVVEPGESTRVTLTWNAGPQHREQVREFARMKTNDPEHPEISIAVLGTVRERLGFDPPELTANRVDPDESASLSTIVYSQRFDDFEIIDVESHLDGFDYSIRPVLPELIDEMNAQSAYRLTVTVPAVEAGESLRDQLVVTVHSDTEADEIQEEIMLQVAVLPRIEFYGSRFDARERVDLGVLTQGEPGEQKLIVRVRGNLQDMPIEVIDVEPSCVRARLEDYKPQAGLYHLTVSVAEDAKPIAFLAAQQSGHITVGNPQEPKLQKSIPVRGQVVPKVE